MSAATTAVLPDGRTLSEGDEFTVKRHRSDRRRAETVRLRFLWGSDPTTPESCRTVTGFDGKGVRSFAVGEVVTVHRKIGKVGKGMSSPPPARRGQR